MIEKIEFHLTQSLHTLSTDPFERKNLYAEHRDNLVRLTEGVAAWPKKFPTDPA